MRKYLRLDLKIKLVKEGKATITVKLSGKLPQEMLEVGLPADQVKRVTMTDRTGKKILPVTQFSDLKGVSGITTDMSDYVELVFE